MAARLVMGGRSASARGQRTTRGLPAAAIDDGPDRLDPSPHRRLGRGRVGPAGICITEDRPGWAR